MSVFVRCRRRPDLNWEWRFCRFSWIVSAVDLSCFLMSDKPSFLGGFGPTLDQVWLSAYKDRSQLALFATPRLAAPRSVAVSDVPSSTPGQGDQAYDPRWPASSSGRRAAEPQVGAQRIELRSEDHIRLDQMTGDAVFEQSERARSVTSAAPTSRGHHHVLLERHI